MTMPSHYKTYDYSHIPISEIEDKDCCELSKIANLSIRELCSREETNLLIFPNQLDKFKDGVADSCICTINHQGLQTEDMMGFVGINDCELTISSRFAKDDKEDYFLHYMLQKVFNINLLDLQHSTSEDRVFDFLAYLFPHYLKKALRQGLYKQYTRKSYNNSNIRGSINIPAHIRRNTPFMGRVSYSVREYAYDNDLTQLIRHAIEYIRDSYMHSVLKTDVDTESYIALICNSTPSYNKHALGSVLNRNLKPITHPLYTEYRILQQLCIMILRHRRIKYGESKDKIYGLLFSGSWLWEEFLFKSLLSECGFKHPQNKIGKGGIYLFEKSDPKEEWHSRSRRYPDYFKDGFVLDAKYKHLDRNIIDRDDMHQVISYMYVEMAQKGGFIYPTAENSVNVAKLGDLRGYKGIMYNIGVPIPRLQTSYKEFKREMDAVIKELKQAKDCNNQGLW